MENIVLQDFIEDVRYYAAVWALYMKWGHHRTAAAFRAEMLCAAALYKAKRHDYR